MAFDWVIPKSWLIPAPTWQPWNFTRPRTYNDYRKKLPSVSVDFGNTEPKNFESASQRQRYHVLTSKEKAA
jgi:hypothetical protein